MANKKPIFTRGYKPVVDNLVKHGKFCRHCNNCHYFYKDYGDEVELCQNSNVTQYDIVVNGTQVYCAFWKPTDLSSQENDKEETYLSRFKKYLKG